MATILDTILEHKARTEVPARKRRIPLGEMRAQAESSPAPRDFLAVLRRPDGWPALIAEVKRASPSKGDLWHGPFDPAAIARRYVASGAAAVSVLTDERFFKGGLAHLKQARAAIDAPILRKDFVVDEYQIHEARAAGADAVLLIAAALNDAMLAEFMDIAEHHKLAALVEVHDLHELERAMRMEATLIGVNNRDLRTFNVDIDATARIAREVRQSPHAALITLVSESGIATAADVRRVQMMGANAVLVGESLIVAGDVEAQARALSTPL